MTESYSALFSRLESAILARGPSATDHWKTAAVEAIRSLNLELDVGKCLQWCIASDLPRQSWENNFGEPAFTVIRNASFRVDLIYWWKSSATTLHKHVSCGAFAAVEGRRLHGVYDFEPTQSFGDDFTTGRLHLRSLTLMQPSACEGIEPDLIHAVRWVDRPSVTLAVRCSDHPGGSGMRPTDYLPPETRFVDVAVHADAAAARRAAGLELLRASNEELYVSTLRHVLIHGEPAFALRALEGAVEWNLDALLELLRAVKRADGLVAVLVRAAHSLYRRKVFEVLDCDNEAAQLLNAALWFTPTTAQVLDLFRAMIPAEASASGVRSAANEIVRANAQARPYIDQLVSDLGLHDVSRRAPRPSSLTR